MSASIGLLEIEFLIPGAATLKEKRKVVRSLKERIRNRHNVSTAEVDHLELPGRCHLAIVTICGDKAEAQKRLESVERMALSIPEISVIDRSLNWL